MLGLDPARLVAVLSRIWPTMLDSGIAGDVRAPDLPCFRALLGELIRDVVSASSPPAESGLLLVQQHLAIVR